MEEEIRKRLVEETRESAILVYEDIEHLNSVIEKSETKAVDLRHSSAILRRWLVEGALKKVANPRVGKMNLKAIDNSPIYRVTNAGKIHQFVSGGASIHGIFLTALMGNAGQESARLENFHPDRTIDLTLDSFQRQRVIFTQETWITRAQVIKFVANVDSGVHDGLPLESWGVVLSEFRQQISIDLITPSASERLEMKMPDEIKTIPSVTFSDGNPASEIRPANYTPNRINGVLLELLATIHFLVKSKDLQNLTAVIASEL